jgi:hypothetical protein
MITSSTLHFLCITTLLLSTIISTLVTCVELTAENWDEITKQKQVFVKFVRGRGRGRRRINGFEA